MGSVMIQRFYICWFKEQKQEAIVTKIQIHQIFKRTLIYYDIDIIIITHKRSFESFMCLDLILER